MNLKYKFLYVFVFFSSFFRIFLKKKKGSINFYTSSHKSGLSDAVVHLKNQINFKSNKKINILVGNPDSILSFLDTNGYFSLINSYNIGHWFWELDKIPFKWQLTKNYIDEIWVYSDYLVSVFKPLNKKIVKIPFIYQLKKFQKYDREYFNIPKNKFIFMFAFDFNSFYERKNPGAIVEAFKKKFKKNKDVILIFKSKNGQHKINDKKNFLSLIQDDENIYLLDIDYNRDKYFSLLSHCDCYISLHRSEGFGLTMYDAMMLNKPVIATGYSGNLEYMNNSNSILIKYKLIKSHKNYLYNVGGLWAEPNINHASRMMFKLYNDIKFREKLITRVSYFKKKISFDQSQYIKKYLQTS